MNIIGLRKIKGDARLTLDKINSNIKSFARSKDFDVTIMQTHSESKAVSYLHRNRNKISHIILAPEAWSACGHIIMEAIKIIETPLILINCDHKKSIFNSMLCEVFNNPNYMDAYIDALKSIE